VSFDPVAALVAFHAALDGRDDEALAKRLAPDAIYQSPGVGTLTGRERIVETIRHYFETLPDQQAWNDEVSRVSGRVAQCAWHLRATNRLTGKVVERRGIETVTFNDAGEVLSVVVEDLA
jgi:ketosteroid isomerase-like protein